MKLLYSFIILSALTLASQGVHAQAMPVSKSVNREIKKVQSHFSPDTAPREYLQNLLEIAEENYGDSLKPALEILNYIIYTGDSLDYTGFSMAAANMKAQFFIGRDDYSKALMIYNDALQYLESSDEKDKLIHSGWFKLEMGNMFYNMEIYNEAETHYHNALQYFNEASHNWGIATSYNNIALCLENEGKLDSALHYYRRALQVRKKMGNQNLITHSHIYLADLYKTVNNEDSARYHLQRAEELINPNDTGNQRYIKEVYILYGEILRENGTLDEARQKYLYALNELDAGFLNLTKNLLIYQRLVEIELLEENTSEAERWALKGLKNSDPKYASEVRAYFLGVLSNIAKKRGNYETALQYSEEQVELLEKVRQDRNNILRNFHNTRVNLVKSERDKKNIKIKNLLEKEEIRKERNIYITAIIILGLVLIILLVIFQFRYKLKFAQSKIERLYNRIYKASENSSNLVLLIDQQGKVRFINRVAKEFFDAHSREEVTENTNFIENLRDEEMRQHWQKIINKDHDKSDWQEVQQFGSGKNPTHLLVSILPLSKANEDFDGLMIVAIDFTERYNQSMLLARQAQDLRNANETKEKIISVLAHDLKEGIYSSQALTEMIVDNPEAEDRDSLIDMMGMLHQNLTKTKHLLEEVLDWIRNQGEEIRARSKWLNCTEVIENLDHNLRKQAEKKGVEFNLDLPKDCRMFADPDMFKSIMRNLMNNALKFCNPREGKVDIKVENEENAVTVIVQDNGVGMAQEVKERILNREKLQSKSGTDGEMGTGLGLKLVQELLELHESSLQIESSPGKGTKIWFSISNARPASS